MIAGHVPPRPARREVVRIEMSLSGADPDRDGQPVGEADEPGVAVVLGCAVLPAANVPICARRAVPVVITVCIACVAA